MPTIGPCSSTRGSQACNGNSGALMPKPSSSSRKGSVCALSGRRAASMSGSAVVLPALASHNPVPTSVLAATMTITYWRALAWRCAPVPWRAIR